MLTTSPYSDYDETKIRRLLTSTLDQRNFDRITGFNSSENQLNELVASARTNALDSSGFRQTNALIFLRRLEEVARSVPGAEKKFLRTGYRYCDALLGAVQTTAENAVLDLFFDDKELLFELSRKYGQREQQAIVTAIRRWFDADQVDRGISDQSMRKGIQVLGYLASPGAVEALGKIIDPNIGQPEMSAEALKALLEIDRRRAELGIFTEVPQPFIEALLAENRQFRGSRDKALFQQACECSAIISSDVVVALAQAQKWLEKSGESELIDQICSEYRAAIAERIPSRYLERHSQWRELIQANSLEDHPRAVGV